ncbi:serine/threonine protein kinase [Catellatospora citrea]|uniref:serine/threonine protein kinase n=1 Tax=Catellatospora citrea TaxID=53366 RepID=UPI001477546D|nr:serine/threonine protein kinase [Catellatospora citrea]
MHDSSKKLLAYRYQLLDVIGQGGQGRVWRARDEYLQRFVAIKELLAPAHLTEQERKATRDRSLREARAVAQLSHPNVIQVYDVIPHQGEPWIVMELVRARSLHQVLAADGPISVQRAADIGLALLGALSAAHRAGILHRDVKPANVLLADDGRVLLTDFGLATHQSADSSVTRTGMVVGSPAYLAPERVGGDRGGPAADLWALGATLFTAVEGRLVFDRPSPAATIAALVTEQPPRPARAGALAPVLEGLLQKDPDQRIDAERAEALLRTALDATRHDSPPAVQPRTGDTTDANPAPPPAAGPPDSPAPDRPNSEAVVPVVPDVPDVPSWAAPTPTPHPSPTGEPPTADTGDVTPTQADRGTGPARRFRPRVALPAAAALILLLSVGVGAMTWRSPALPETRFADATGFPPAVAPPAGSQQSSPKARPAPSAPPSPAATTTPGTSGQPSGTPWRSPLPSPSPTTNTSQPAAPPVVSHVGEITGIGGKCVDVSGARRADGTPIVIFTCNGSAAQTWTMKADGTVRALGKCLDVQDDGTYDGAAVQLWSCGTGQANQRWVYDSATRHLVNPASGTCLDARDQSSADGTRLQIWTCNPNYQANQRWSPP